MKMKSYVMPALALALLTTVISCKKESSTTPTDNSTEVQAQNDDQSTVSTEVDGVGNDASASMEGNGLFSGRTEGTQGLVEMCGTTTAVDSVNNIITITYNGNNCNGTALRTGTVTLSLSPGKKWKDSGAVITANIQNLKIKRLSDGKSITINGTHLITNVNGGLVRNFQSAPTQVLVQTITSNNMSLTFDDGSKRTWNVARKRTITYSNGVFTVSIRGIGSTNGITNACEWGMNRENHEFTTAIMEPLVYRTDCAAGITSGQIKHTGFATSTVTFGLNANGEPTACPGTGAHYYFKLVWTGPNGNSVSAIHAY